MFFFYNIREKNSLVFKSFYRFFMKNKLLFNFVLKLQNKKKY